MPTTNQLIYAQTLTSAASSVTFSSIPQTFTDLIIKYSTRVDFGGDPTLKVIFNSNTSNYSNRMLYGSGSSAISGTSSPSYIYGGYACNTGHTANTFSNNYMHIPNYTSNNYKSVSVDSVIETNATECYQFLIAGLWSNTSSITSISIGPLTGNLAAGSSLYLYGVSSDTVSQNTDGPYAFGGDTITTDGTYWYHTFLNSNSFIPQKNLSNVDFLVVAGGGGGGGGDGAEYGAGGGGAGGARSSVTWTGGNSIGNNLESKLTLTANTPYACVIGAGGAKGIGGSSNNSTNGTQGDNSSISGTGITTITSTGGGYGGKGRNTSGGGSTPGGAGGSGGGGGGRGNSVSGGSPTSNQGYAGGDITSNSVSNAGAGGGGASAAGVNASADNVGTAGGAGIYTALTNAVSVGQLSNSNYYVAGGGGGAGNGTGGAGGLGGGGAGTSAAFVNATAGTANTGGGGGGGGANSTYGVTFAGQGGSGIIIIRYPV